MTIFFNHLLKSKMKSVFSDETIEEKCLINQLNMIGRWMTVRTNGFYCTDASIRIAVAQRVAVSNKAMYLYSLTS